MIIGMDLDGVITKNTGGWTSDYYSSCVPNADTISLMKELNQMGCKIIIYTSRLENEVRIETLQWLKKHGVPYDAIHFDKPLYDFMVDDKNITTEQLKELLFKEYRGNVCQNCNSEKMRKTIGVY